MDGRDGMIKVEGDKGGREPQGGRVGEFEKRAARERGSEEAREQGSEGGEGGIKGGRV